MKISRTREALSWRQTASNLTIRTRLETFANAERGSERYIFRESIDVELKDGEIDESWDMNGMIKK
eukprot:499764-Hanusia_phi.AAC.1